MNTDFGETILPQWVSRPTVQGISYPYYNDETLRTAGKDLECGDLSPLLPLWRLVAKAGPRPAVREIWTPSRIRRRQVACRKRGQVRALQSGCGSAALCSSVSIRGFHLCLSRECQILNQALITCSDSQRLKGLRGWSEPPLRAPQRGLALDNPMVLRTCSNVASCLSAARMLPATRDVISGPRSAG